MAKSRGRVLKLLLRPARSHGSQSVCLCSDHYTSISILLFLSFSSHFITFSEASRSIPTNVSSSSTSSTTTTTTSSITNPPPTSPLKTSHTHFDSRIVIALVISSAVFFAFLILIMAFKCFGFKLERKQNRVSSTVIETAVDDDDDLGFDGENSVKKFSWEEMEKSTDNFSMVIGSGGFSTVFLARYPVGLRAIKIHSGSERLNQVFKQELDILLHLRHDHIVKLLGYCDDREEGALVFEYVANGNLQEKLHGEASELPWKNRMAIAFQVAQAMEYLHEKCALQIVHMDIKASNVLLDENLNCKLCDFGSAKMGFSSTVQPPSSSSSLKIKQVMTGSPGYTDPHYIRTGIASKKNDVYSFGVLLLELVTGMEAFCPEKGQLLTSVVGPRLSDLDTTAELVDPRLAGSGGFDVEEARAVLSVAATCLRQSPSLRPSATCLMETIQSQINSISFLQDQDRHSPHKS